MPRCKLSSDWLNTHVTEYSTAAFKIVTVGIEAKGAFKIVAASLEASS